MCVLAFHLCYYETHVSQQKQLWSHHPKFDLLLTFVNVAKKDVSVGRFTVPAAGANATRKMQNRFSRNHHAGKFLQLSWQKRSFWVNFSFKEAPANVDSKQQGITLLCAHLYF